MPVIKGLEAGVIQMLINLNKVNAKEAGKLCAEGLDKALDARYGDKRSEEVQNSLLEALELFWGAFKGGLKADQVPLPPSIGPVAPPPPTIKPAEIKKETPKTNISPKNKGGKDGYKGKTR